jgi:hypothetical protein
MTGFTKYTDIPVLTLAAFAVSCGGEQQSESAQADAANIPAAEIIAPVTGVTVDGPDVRFQLGVSGISLAPAGVDSANTGHLHLFINHELTPEGTIIPAGDGIVHLGLAQSEHVLEDLEPGEYTVIVVLGDYLHARIPGSQTDTVRFNVR